MFDPKPFLDEIARKTYYTVGFVHLYRLVRGALIDISNCGDNLDYVKPDIGYRSPIQEYVIMANTAVIARFSLYEFPSCCAFCVSTDAYVEPQYRRRGINTLANKLRQHIAKESGYTALICTDRVDNIGERKTLENNEFVDIFTIVNKRTSNRVAISIKVLE